MKQSISTTTTFKLMIIFIFIFSGFIVLTIAYNRAYKIKNETVRILEKYEGVSNNSLSIINSYLKNSGYKTKGHCADGEFGMESLDYPAVTRASQNSSYYYCLESFCDTSSCTLNSGNKIYYGVKIFFKFDLPILGDLLTFNITGETKAINFYSASQKLS